MPALLQTELEPLRRDDRASAAHAAETLTRDGDFIRLLNDLREVMLATRRPSVFDGTKSKIEI